jgi:hypothetical protein
LADRGTLAPSFIARPRRSTSPLRRPKRRSSPVTPTRGSRRRSALMPCELHLPIRTQQHPHHAETGERCWDCGVHRQGDGATAALHRGASPRYAPTGAARSRGQPPVAGPYKRRHARLRNRGRGTPRHPVRKWRMATRRRCPWDGVRPFPHGGLRRRTRLLRCATPSGYAHAVARRALRSPAQERRHRPRCQISRRSHRRAPGAGRAGARRPAPAERRT